MAQQKCLVIGSAGFIGRNLSRRFSTEGYRVIGIDTTAMQAEDASDSGLDKFVTGSAACPLLDDILSDCHPDVIVNCSGSASVANSVQNPAADFHDNASVTFSILDAVRRRSPSSKFVFLSTAAVYGNPEVLPVAETAPGRPISPYGFHKLMSEQICKEHVQLYGTKVVVARIFSAYGPGNRKQILWDICRKIQYEDEVILYGTGNETRDFIYVDDISDCIWQLVEKAPCRGEAYNVASGTETTILFLAETILREMKSTKKLRFNEVQRHGDPRNWKADISRIAGMGIKPCTSIETGIAEYARWYRRTCPFA